MVDYKEQTDFLNWLITAPPPKKGDSNEGSDSCFFNSWVHRWNECRALKDDNFEGQHSFECGGIRVVKVIASFHPAPYLHSAM